MSKIKITVPAPIPPSLGAPSLGAGVGAAVGAGVGAGVGGIGSGVVDEVVVVVVVVDEVVVGGCTTLTLSQSASQIIGGS